MNACMVTLTNYHTLKQKRLMCFEGPCRLFDYLVQRATHKSIRLSRQSKFVYFDILSKIEYLFHFSVKAVLKQSRNYLLYLERLCQSVR